jgi:hypothetical protein
MMSVRQNCAHEWGTVSLFLIQKMLKYQCVENVEISIDAGFGLKIPRALRP